MANTFITLLVIYAPKEDRNLQKKYGRQNSKHDLKQR